MNFYLNILFWIALAALPLGFIAKFILLKTFASKRKRTYQKSFFRWYNVYDMHNAGSGKYGKFMRISNLINLFFWGGVIYIMVFMLYNTKSKHAKNNSYEIIKEK